MDTDYFRLLGLDIDQNLDAELLKAAYRRAARDAHPDAGGSDEQFRRVKAAYETLSDPNRARLYRAELALHEVRLRLERDHVPASDYVPYVLDQIDPTGRFAGAGRYRRASPPDKASASTAGTAAQPQPAPHTTNHRAGPAGSTRRRSGHATPGWPWYWNLITEVFEQDTRPWDGNDWDFEARARWFAAAQSRIDINKALDREMDARMRALLEVPYWWRALGAALGIIAATVGIGLWDFGLAPDLLGVDPGDRISLLRTYDPDFVHSDAGMLGWRTLGAWAGWSTIGLLGRIRRRYRVEDRLLAAAAVPILLIGWALPAITGSVVATVAVTATVTGAWRWWMWFRRRGRRYLDTDVARQLGLLVNYDARPPETILSDVVVTEVVNDTIGYWAASADEQTP